MLSDEIAVMIRRKAEEIAVEMRIDAPHGETGVYASSFTVESGLDVLEGDRGASFVINDADYATALEVGSWNIRNPPMPMTSVLRRIGGL